MPNGLLSSQQLNSSMLVYAILLNILLCFTLTEKEKKDCVDSSNKNCETETMQLRRKPLKMHKAIFFSFQLDAHWT